MSNPNANSIRLIAALALASHSPRAKQTQAPSDPIPAPSSSNSSDTDGSHRSSVDFDALLNDPSILEAIAHIRESVKSTSGLDALSDPRVQRAIHQACEAMRNSEAKDANRRSLLSITTRNRSSFELPLSSPTALARYAAHSQSSPPSSTPTTRPNPPLNPVAVAPAINHYLTPRLFIGSKLCALRPPSLAPIPRKFDGASYAILLASRGRGLAHTFTGVSFGILRTVLARQVDFIRLEVRKAVFKRIHFLARKSGKGLFATDYTFYNHSGLCRGLTTADALLGKFISGPVGLAKTFPGFKKFGQI
ncbi:hypothetical protein L0F63_002054 [Massospora cicadina]|nr:hypothetical protein L0F63_002054 [Massospora cicadina]